MPASSLGNMGGSVREPALSVTLWLSWGAVLGAVTCAVALLIQQAELQSLRREVSRLQRSGGASQKRGEPPWQSLWEQSPDVLGAWKDGAKSRRRRAVLTQKHKKKHSVLHLVPINITSKADSDVTEVMWQPALRRGRGLEAQGDTVRVRDTGIYLLYSQVLFHDVTFTMGQVVSREGQGRRETLFRCIKSMPSDPDRAYNSCYSAGPCREKRHKPMNDWIRAYNPMFEAEVGVLPKIQGVFHLHQGDIVTVKIPRANAKLSLSPHGTFLGFVKL